MRNLLNLGKTLSKVEQKQINGGDVGFYTACGDFNTNSGASCNPYGLEDTCNGNESCQGTLPVYIGGEVIFTGGVCAC